MIKANELRIGNWVMTPLNMEAKIAAAGIEDVENNQAHYEPIPLTPEILEKAGFINNGFSVDSNWHYKLVSIPTNHMNVTYELNLFTTEEKGKYGINLEEQYFGYCKHLHQLQNLYFALTGEELNVTL